LTILRIAEKGFNPICIADSMEKDARHAEKLAAYGLSFDRMKRQ
jgi:hypothetical protein